MYSNDSAQVEFIMLDASCLHEIAIAKANQTQTEIVQWFHSILDKDRIVIVPEMVRYVVHRQLQLDRQSRVAFALEDLLEELVCIPIDSEITKRAAAISADFRQENTELTLSMLDSLDKDAILIAQHDKFKADRKGKVNLVLATFEDNHSPLQGINIKNWKNISMYDVFLSYNREDKSEVLGIAEDLERRDIITWVDEWDISPGQSWQKLIQEQITLIESAAVFVGKNGIGPWQDEEIQALLQQYRQRGCTVIPVLLPSAPSNPAIPLFLGNIKYVDFRQLDSNPLDLLIVSIKGESPRSLRNSQ